MTPRTRSSQPRALRNLQLAINYKGRSRLGKQEEEGRKDKHLLLLMRKTVITWKMLRVWGGRTKEMGWCVKDMMKWWKADLVTFQETKLEQISSREMRDLWGRRPILIHKPAVGSAGGILVAWNSKVLKVFDSKGVFHISTMQEQGG